MQANPFPNDSHIVIAGAATGGHLAAALAIAEQLSAINPALRVTLASGEKRTTERSGTTVKGYAQIRLRAQSLPRGLGGAWRFLSDNMSGYRQARRFVRGEQVSLVIGLGTHASLPMAAAAARMGVPLVLVEQNSVPGRVNRLLAPCATLVCIAFEEARARLKSHGPIRLTGVPILTSSAFQLPQHLRDDRSHDRLVVLAGNGSGVMNEAVPKALYKLRNDLNGWQIIHQSGARDAAATHALYGKLGLQAIVAPAIGPAYPLLRASSLAVSRASGSMVAQLAAALVPAVLLPNRAASNDHQQSNAERMVQAGAARAVDERTCGGRLDDAVADALGELLINPLQRERMAQAARNLARPDAAWQIATMANDLISAERLRAAA
jgi:UDP-N-acetylglucosamine--N-acetylmuramyl-(pentapeptide) pyrophosphoryl-undecaprenol N-acetylglucosamine transferase